MLNNLEKQARGGEHMGNIYKQLKKHEPDKEVSGRIARDLTRARNPEAGAYHHQKQKRKKRS